MAEDPYKDWLKAKANYLASLENNEEKYNLYMDWLEKNPMPGSSPSKPSTSLTPDSGKISNIKKDKVAKKGYINKSKRHPTKQNHGTAEKRRK